MISNIIQRDEILDNYTVNDESILICCVSFESRSIEIEKKVYLKANRLFAFYLEEYEETVDNINSLKELYGSKINLIKLSLQNPIYSYSEISKAIIEAMASGLNIIVDITTFTHETLLMLLYCFYKYKYEDITFVYLGAQDYSLGLPIDKKWLSKGCKEIRNVLGYPGELNISMPTCLTVLTGYENERAIGSINEIDAESNIVGNGMANSQHVTATNHFKTMEHFKELYGSLLSTRKNVQFFDFSPKNLSAVITELKKQIDGNLGYNHVIVPLNTKISTLAVGLYALKNRHVQICYALPEIYNVTGYSLAGEKMIECKINLQKYQI